MGMLRGTRRALFGGQKYYEKVLATSPIAYWPLWEPSGTVSRDLVLPAQNGTYSSDVSTWPVGAGIGDGRTSPFFDGAGGFNNVLTPALVGRFSGAECTLMVWMRMAQPPDDPWTDGAVRFFMRFQVDANNEIILYKNDVNNQIAAKREGGGVSEWFTVDGLTSTDWQCWGLTVSQVADEARLFLDGEQQGATAGALGAWAGNLNIAIIGAQTLAPVSVHHGWLSHGALWDRALLPAMMEKLQYDGEEK